MKYILAVTEKAAVFKYRFLIKLTEPYSRTSRDKIYWTEFWALVQIFMEPLSEAKHLH